MLPGRGREVTRQTYFLKGSRGPVAFLSTAQLAYAGSQTSTSEKVRPRYLPQVRRRLSSASGAKTREDDNI